ncbi:MAG: hypothetical protein U5K29_13895 [Acidimicrobiales bacterium]|nr:hypothetical protein [Acidimicrobiales bacterium]
MLITEFLAGLTLTTKVVAGGVAVVATTAAAGAADVLPTQAESAPEQSTEISVEGEAPADPSDVVTVTDDSLPDAAEFGTRVAELAREGGVDGPSIAAKARTQGEVGLDKADSTPAADHRPEDVPEGPTSLPAEAGAEAGAETEVDIEATVDGSARVPSDPAASGDRNPQG